MSVVIALEVFTLVQSFMVGVSSVVDNKNLLPEELVSTDSTVINAEFVRYILVKIIAQ